MKQIEIYTCSFFEFVCEDRLTTRILDLVQEETYYKSVSNNASYNDLFFDKELFDWFDDCLYKLKNKLGYPDNISLPITSCWSNKSKKLMAHHKHSHSNSIISGIFYLTTHDFAPTIFYQKNAWKLDENFNFDNSNFQTEITHKIYPKKSTLILFPSSIPHSVPAVTSNEERYTIAFNTYVSGFINKGNEKCRLEIRTKSVRDFYENTEQTS